MTMRAWLRGGLDHAGAQTLSAHLEQPKTRNAAHLNAGTVAFQFILNTFLNRQIVFALIHIDEIDHD